MYTRTHQEIWIETLAGKIYLAAGFKDSANVGKILVPVWAFNAIQAIKGTDWLLPRHYSLVIEALRRGKACSTVCGLIQADPVGYLEILSSAH